MTQANASIGYLLINAFEYEIRNHVDIKITQLASNKDDLGEEESDELKKLNVVREYLQQRIGALKG